MEVDAAKCDERTAQQNVALAINWSSRFLGLIINAFRNLRVRFIQFL